MSATSTQQQYNNATTTMRRNRFSTIMTQPRQSSETTSFKRKPTDEQHLKQQRQQRIHILRQWATEAIQDAHHCRFNADQPIQSSREERLPYMLAHKRLLKRISKENGDMPVNKSDLFMINNDPIIQTTLCMKDLAIWSTHMALLKMLLAQNMATTTTASTATVSIPTTPEASPRSPLNAMFQRPAANFEEFMDQVSKLTMATRKENDKNLVICITFKREQAGTETECKFPNQATFVAIRYLLRPYWINLPGVPPQWRQVQTLCETDDAAIVDAWFGYLLRHRDMNGGTWQQFSKNHKSLCKVGASWSDVMNNRQHQEQQQPETTTGNVIAMA